MRLWTLHPRYLDTKGLVAGWREALLAQKALAGNTRGYQNHPQLIRFRQHADPAGAIARFLSGLADEADRRGYRFDRSKIPGFSHSKPPEMSETRGQFAYERAHLLAKLQTRAPDLAREFALISDPVPHPMFTLVPGEIQPWEKR